jgi:hypothetical protein
MEISRFDAGAAVLHLDEIDLAESVRRTLASRGWSGTVETTHGTPRGPTSAAPHHESPCLRCAGQR